MLRSGSGPSELQLAVATTRRVGRTFALSTRLLPRGVRPDVYLLYLVCRTLDDLVDEGKDDALQRIENVRRWAMHGAVEGREARILEGIWQRHPELPRDAVLDLCRGLAADLQPRAMLSEADLDVYASRVAGSVGRLIAGILGGRSPGVEAAAEALGIAMQRTNVLRDIDEDLARGRIYIPEEALRALGLTDLEHDDRRNLLAHEIALADAWYERALPSTRLLRRGARPVKAAALMYREILRQIERDGMGARRPWRARVSRMRKMMLLLRALVRG